MPELPEIEHLKRSLEPSLQGAMVAAVKVIRSDVIHVSRSHARIHPSMLLRRWTISRLDRKGKQLAILTDDGPALCIHLGMSGQLRFVPKGERLLRPDHVHCRWQIKGPCGEGMLVFRDPRRFGGIWLLPDRAAVMKRWSRLGPDALGIQATVLSDRLAARERPIKAALLDQQLIAGIGNIYADEALFAARIHPLTSCVSLSREQIKVLAHAIRTTLRRAVAAGGSTLRDYSDGNGEAGWFKVHHRVYGRAELPCELCGGLLERLVVAQRTTVVCSTCQDLSM